MCWTRLLLLTAMLLSGVVANAQVLYEGKLGPIKYDMRGVDKTVKPQIRDAVRERLTPMFSGKGEVVYRIDFKVRAGDTRSERPKKGQGIVGAFRAEWQATMELSRYRPDRESLAVTTFPLWVILQTEQYRGPRGSDHQQYHLMRILPERMAIALREFRGEDVSDAVAGYQRMMNRPVNIVEGLTRVVSGVTVGVSAAGKAGMGILEVIGDPAVAGVIHDGLQQANRDMVARDREFQRQALEIQAMVHEARNESIEQLRQRTAQQRQQRPPPITTNVAAPQGSHSAQVDEAREKCLARGAQWVASKRHCLLHRSVAERRKACESNGGVLLEQDWICWRGTSSGRGYVSENLDRTATGAYAGSNQASAGQSGAQSAQATGQRESSSPSVAASSADSSSVGAAAKACEPVNQQGVRIPMTRIPERYHCYMFSDERLLEWGRQDMSSSSFFYEAASEERARSDAVGRLRSKALKQCRQMGFGAGVSLFGEDYSKGALVRAKAENCQSNARMGSTFWMCEAQGSFRCGQPQS